MITPANNPGYVPDDRRPIKSRESGLWKRCAAGLAGRGVTANAISVAGMVAGVAAGAALTATGFVGAEQWGGVAWRLLWFAGAVGVQFRLICNMLDGMVALAAGSASRVGELYNEVPDRVSDVATLVGLGYAAGSSPTLGWAAAVVAVVVAYVRAVGKGGGVAGAFHGPMAKPHRMFTVTLVALLIALLPIGWTLHVAGPDDRWGLPHLALGVIVFGGLFTAWRRLRFVGFQLRGAPTATLGSSNDASGSAT